MINGETQSDRNDVCASIYGNSELATRIDNAYKIYKLSRSCLDNAGEDYGKLKIARLGMEFARHELFALLGEAKEKGINYNAGIERECLYGES